MAPAEHSHHGADIAVKGEEAPLANRPAPGVSFFTPLQDPAAGTAQFVQDGGKMPKLFTPLKLRGVTFQNRIALSPLCQYSAADGHMQPWHTAHLGGIVSRGPGLTFVEATAVVPEGRITPEDCGIWQDSQIEPLKKIVEFAHSQNQQIGIQLAHAGRKASTVAPWLSAGDIATKELNGWPDNVKGPSAIPYNDRHAKPKEMTKQDIDEFKAAYKAAVERSVKAGIDVIEIHNAHGYLLHSFLSPASNNRTDEYGGSFENRIRLTLEIVDICRSAMPKDMPLFLRISATDWLEEAGIDGWTVEQTCKLAPMLAERGVDLLDISSGGLHEKQHIHSKPGYQVPFAVEVKKAVGDKTAVSAVGSITEGKQAEGYLQEGDLDMIFVGRMFQKNPGMVWQFADDLGVEARWANQIRWGFAGRAKRKQQEEPQEGQ